MLNLADLGFEPADTKTIETDEPAQDGPAGLVPIEPGSVVAKTLYHVWSGQPVTIVDSPPGAGKSTLVATVSQHLAAGSTLSVRIAAPTRDAVRALAQRIDQITETGAVSTVGSAFKGESLFASNDDLPTPIQVSTVASCRSRAPECDLLIFDEAYQATYADVLAASERADQVLMVGDPGQIGPVITANTAVWDRLRVAPADRAPEGFSQRGDAKLLSLPSTFRLGGDSASAIAPLYRFPFDSRRPNVALDGFDEIEALIVPPATHVAEQSVMAQAVERVQSLIGAGATSDMGVHELVENDIVVLAARNEQVAMLSALLHRAGLGNVTVGTADRLQGGEWAAAVAIDPLFGVTHASGHSAALGRLCVMASRHFAHLTWVGSDDWQQVIERSNEVLGADAQVHTEVREALMGQ